MDIATSALTQTGQPPDTAPGHPSATLIDKLTKNNDITPINNKVNYIEPKTDKNTNQGQQQKGRKTAKRTRSPDASRTRRNENRLIAAIEPTSGLDMLPDSINKTNPQIVSQVPDPPNHKYTHSQILQAVPGSKGILSTVAKRLGGSRYMLWCYCNESPEFAEELRQACQQERQLCLDNAEVALQMQIERGNINAIKFFLSTQGKERGYTERNELAVAAKLQAENINNVSIEDIRQATLTLRQCLGLPAPAPDGCTATDAQNGDTVTITDATERETAPADVGQLPTPPPDTNGDQVRDASPVDAGHAATAQPDATPTATATVSATTPDASAGPADIRPQPDATGDGTPGGPGAPAPATAPGAPPPDGTPFDTCAGQLRNTSKHAYEKKETYVSLARTDSQTQEYESMDMFGDF